jgi:MscS family membrane protein
MSCPTEMRNKIRCIVAALLLAAPSPAWGQIPGLPAPAGPSPAEEAPDPLGRDTPSGTILGFNDAVRRGDIVSATMYMQVTAAQRANAEALARELKALIDR